MNFLAKTAPLINPSEVPGPGREITTGFTLEEPSRVFLNISAADISNFSRVGNDLVMVVCGDIVTISGFFLPEAPSELFLRGEAGEAVLVQLEGIGADGSLIARFVPQLEAAPFESLVGSAVCVITPESGSGLSQLGVLLGTVLGGALLAGALNDDSGGASPPVDPGVPDSRAPQFVAASLSADGSVLSLEYDEALDGSNPPDAGSFSVLVNGVAVAVTSVAIVGARVQLTLAAPVPAGAAVTIGYGDPTPGNDANALQDAAGNDAASLAATAVANPVGDSTPPAFVSAATSTDGATLVLSYDEALDGSNPPAAGSFVVQVNGVAVAVTAVAVIGNTLVLTLASPVAEGAVVSVAYADPTPGNDAGAIQDASGNDAASLAATSVTNLVGDTTPPALVSAVTSADGATLVLAYDGILDAANPPTAGSFVVNVNGTPVAVTAVAIVGASVVLTLATPVASGAAVTLAYNDPSAGNDANAIQDAAGNDAASLAPTGVTNTVLDSTAPVFVSAATSVDGVTLVLSYDEALDAANPPAASGYVVNVNGTPVAVTGVAVAGSSVVLTLAAAVPHGAAVTFTYTDPSAGNDAAALQDAAGNDAASLPLTNASNLVPDTTPPAFVAAATSADGSQLVLTYDEALDAANAPGAGSFLVNVNGSAVAVSSAQISGNSVVLTLASAVANGAAVTVTYSDPTAGNDGQAIQDAAGNDAASLAQTPVNNLVPDGISPTFVSAATGPAGATLVLTYDEALDAANLPPAGSFLVNVDGTAVAVTGVAVVGSTVVLSLATPVANGAVVTVAYADASAANDATAIQDAAGNDAASLLATSVNNLVADGTPPAFVSAVTGADGASLVLTYDEALDAANPPAAGSFVVTVAGVAVAVSGVAVSGQTVVLTLAGAVPNGAAVTVAYADPTVGNDGSAIQDAAGNDAASLATTGVTNAVPDTTAPAFVSAATSADGATLTLAYDEALDAANAPLAAGFVVTVNGLAVAVTGVAVNGSAVVLTLATPVANGAAVTVAYTDPSAGNDGNAIQDAAGNDAASLPTTAVSNLVPDSTPPAFVSAATSSDGATLVLTYDDQLDAANTPAAGSFLVNVNGTPVTVTGVAVVGGTVVLTLATPVANGAAVTVAYADPTTGNDAGAIQDASGNDAASLGATAVSNTVPDGTAPVFVSAATSADGATLTLTYGEALDAGNAPAAGSFVVNVNGTPVVVASVAIAGADVVLTLASPVPHGASVTVAYADPTAGNDAAALQDAAGNDAASLAPTPVNNNVADGTPPAFVSAATSADGLTLVLTYDEALDAAQPPLAGSFVVNANGVALAVTGVSIVGATVVLALGTPVASGAAVSVAYTDASGANDASAIQDAAGNDAASLPLTNASNLVPDTTPPAFVSAATSADGLRLVLSYGEALDAANPPPPGGFVVNVNGSAVAVTGVAVAGSTLVLTLASAVASGAAVDVAYTDPTAGNDGAAIQDAAGNDALSLAPTAVSNLVPDGIAPTFVSAATGTDGTTLVLSYDAALDAGNPPAAGRFVVNVNGAVVAATAVAVSGNTVVLTLASPVANGAVVTVAYADPTTGNDAAAIQDAAGNDAASLLPTSVSNLVADVTPPTLVSAVTGADGATLVLNYSEALDAANPPAAARFVVDVNGQAVAVTGVAIAGASVVLTLASAVPNGAAVTVAYADPSTGNDANAIQDAAGNDAASLAATGVTNTVPDSGAPAFVSAVTSADGATLTLDYNEALDAGNAPAAASFVVNVGGVPVQVTGVAVVGASVVLTLASPVPNGAAVSVAYNDPTAGNDGNAIQDAAGNDAASLPATAVGNLVPDTTPPVFVAAATSADGATLVLTYDGPLDAGNPPAASSFVVNVNGTPVLVTGVAVVGNGVVLTLATPVAHGAAVTLGYTDPSTGNDAMAIQDAAGNDAAGLPPTSVTNQVPDGLAPSFVSAVTSADGTRLVLSYSEALDAANAPTAGSFVVNVGGVPVAVSAVAIDGSNVVLTLASPVVNGAAVTVAYTDPTAGNDASAIQDAAGNDAASLAPTGVGNAVPDSTPPAFVSAATSADGTALVLSYSEALDAANAPLANAFSVRVNGVAVAVNAVAIAGASVVLTLATPVAHGATVSVSYADPSVNNDGNAIQDVAGNDAASLALTNASNLVPDTTPPAFVSAATSADGATLVLTYDEALAAAAAPAAASFVVTVNGAAVGVTDVAIAGSTLVLTLATAVPSGAAVTLSYGDPTTGNDANAVQDAAGNDAASLAPTAVSNLVPDGVAPTFVSAATGSDGTTLVLNYDSALDAVNLPSAGLFVVNVNGVAVPVSAVAVAGSSVVLTLASPVANGAVVTVAYTDPSAGNDGAAIQDAAGSDAASLVTTSVTNAVPDTTAPAFVSAATSANGASLVLTYSEALDAGNPPLAGSFVVQVGGTPVAVTAVAIVGASVVLTLAAPVANGAAVSVAYNDPSTGNDSRAIQDAAGNDAASLAPTGVTNTVPDSSAPAFVSASTSLDGSTLTLTYSEALDAGNPPAVGAFVVTANGLPVVVSSLVVAGSSVVLTLASPVANGVAVTVAYNDATTGNDGSAIQDAAGNDAASLPATAVSNLVPDTAAPAFVAAATSTDGATLVLTYDGPLDAANPPAAGSFVVNVNGTPVTPASVAIVGSTVVLTLATPVANGAAVTVGYTDPSANDDGAAVQDAAGNDAATLAPTAVTNNVPDTTAPVFVSAATSTDGATLVLSYDGPLDAANPPAAGSFVVNVNGLALTPAAAAVVGSTVVLTLATPVPNGATVAVSYTDPSAGNDGSAIQDAAGNDAASLALTNASNLVPDTTPPAFVSAATSADGTTLTLTYSEALDAGNAPAVGAFVVNADGVPVAVSSLVVAGSSVVLTLASPVANGAAVTVAYNDPTTGNDGNAIQDAAGNDAATLPATSVSNLVPDGVTPTFVSATTSADGATLVLSYDEALDAANPPLVGSFVVTVNGVAVTPSGVAIVGSTVVLTLATPVANGALLTVAYNDPGAGNDGAAIQDAAGNDAATLAPTAVTNAVPDNTAPAFVSATTSADGTTLILSYSEGLDAVNLPPTSNFLVTVNGAPVAVSGLNVSGSAVTLTLATPVANGATVTVGYTDPSASNDGNALQDLAGNDAATLVTTGVTNAVPDTGAPGFVFAATSSDGTTLTLNYSEALDAGNPPAASSFVVNVNGTPVTPASVAIVGSTVVLTLATPVAHGAAVTVGYTDPSANDDGAAVQDAAGNDAATLAPTAVTNNVPDTTAPVFVSAATSTDGATLVLSYDGPLDAANPPAAGSFVVNVNGVAVAASAAAVVGNTVVLTLATPVPNGAGVTVAYTDPTTGNDANAIQDAGGNDAANLAATPVSNNVPDTTAPMFVSAATSADGATLVLSYDGPLDAANPPAAGSFVVNINGVPVTPGSVAIVGSTVVLTLATPVANGATVAVSYDDPSANNDGSAIQDAAGNDAASLPLTNASNLVPDTSPPAFVSAATSVDGTTLVLSYSEALDAANLPAAGSFVVNVNGVAAVIAGVSVVGSSVVLTLGTPVAHGATVAVSYADPSVNNDGSAIQDGAGNDAASLALTNASNLVPDTTPPAFVSAATSADGASLVLTYGEALDAINAPGAGDFVVNVNGIAVGVTAVAIDGRSVVLTLATPVVNDAAVTVAYTDPSASNDGAAIQDAAGNDAATLPATSVSNLVPDGITPTFVSATTSADGATLVLGYDETLDAANPPLVGSFVVTVNGVAVTPSAVAIVGSTVVLTLATPVANGALLTVAYNDPGAGNDGAAIQDAAGNDAATLAPTAVTNAVPDTTAPAFVSATTSADGTTLILSYSEALDAANLPPTSSFLVTVDGAPVAVTFEGVFGSTLVLTLASPVPNGAAVTVAYGDPSANNDGNAVQDLAGNDAPTLPTTGVTNAVPDTSAPTFVSAATSTDGTTLTLSYSETLDAANPPQGSDFEVNVNGTRVAVTGVQVSGSGVVLTLATPVTNGAAVTVAYADPGADDDAAAIQDVAGNDAASLSATAVSNTVPDTVAPVFVSAATSTDGGTLVLTYSEPLDAGNAPPTGAFTVSVNGAVVAVNSLAVVAGTVVLNLATPVPHGAAVTVAYGDPSPGNDGNAIQDAAGNDAATLAATAVSNNVPDTIAPVFVSAATSADGATLVLTYDEALDGLNRPAAGSFSVNVNGAPVAVTAVSVVGNAVVLTLATPVANGAAVTVAYLDTTAGNDANAIQDGSGNDAASLAVTAVNNTVPDTTAPAFVSAVTSADGATLTLTYSEALDAANLPAAADFVVSVNGAVVAVTGVAVAGSTLRLTLATPVPNGVAVTVAYNDPSALDDANAVQDAAGNDAATLLPTGVNNTVPDSTPPGFVSAATSTNGATVTLGYSEALDAANPPLPGAFTVTVNGVQVGVTALAVVGASVVLTLATPVANGAVVTVAYADPSGGNDPGAIQDAAGNDAASLAATSVSNLVPDTSAPAFVSAVTSADGASLVLSYSEALDAVNLPAAGDFVVNANGVAIAVTGVTVVGATVVLALATPVAHGAVVTLAYADPSLQDDLQAIQDQAGNDAASLATTGVVNAVPDSSAPVFVSAATSADGTTLTLNYNETLDAANPPAATAFAVTVNGVAVAVSAVAVVGSTVLLTLATAVANGAAVTVGYDDPATGDDLAAIQDAAGNDAATLAPTNVSNLVPDGTSPTFVSAATSADGGTLVLTYDDQLDAANPPEAQSFTVTINGAAVQVTNVSVTGATVLLTLATAVTLGATVTVAYADPSVDNDAVAIQDLAGNDAASLLDTAVTNLVPDGIAPTFVSAATTTDGTALVLTYDNLLDGVNLPAVEAFAVRVNGVAVAVTATAVDGSTIVLTLATAVPNGAGVTVAYTDPTGADDAQAIQDTAGNDAASLPLTGVSNQVADTAAPVFVSASTGADGTTVTLTYSEALDAANPPIAGSFVLNVNGVAATIANVLVSGNSVVLTLDTPVANGASVTVAYTDPSGSNDGSAIQDTAGNDAASLPATGVTNTVPDTTAPVFVSAVTSADGNALVLSYSELLDGANPPAAESFVVNVNGVRVDVNAVTVNGASVTLGLVSPVANGAAVSVAYADPSGGNDAAAIQDAVGNDAATLAPTPVNNTVPDTTPPAFVSAVTSANGATVVLSYSEALDAANAPLAADFVVKVNGVAVSITALAVSGNAVVLTLASPVTNGAVLSVAYADPSSGNDVRAIQDAAGNDAASLAETGVSNTVPDTTPPSFVSAVTSTNGATLTLTYNEALDAANPPVPGNFVVRVNGAAVPVSSLAVIGSTVVLTLASPVANGAAVTVAYNDPTGVNDGNAVQDAAGNDALSLADTAVSNAVPDTTPPAFVSAVTSANGATLSLTYSEALDAANPPPAGSFTVNVNGVAVGVTAVAVAGASVVLTLATPVANGAVVTVAYADPSVTNDTAAIQDAAGNDAASLPTTGVSNVVPDTTPPAFVSAATSTDGRTLVLTYDEALDAVNVPPAGAFVVNVSGVPVGVTGTAVAGNTLVLVLSSSVPNGAAVSVAYADPSLGNDAAAIQDAAGNDAASLPTTAVANRVPDTTPPVFVSASTSSDGATLVLTYGEALDALNPPLAGAFTVTVNGAQATATGLSVVGSTVVLALASPVANGAAVTVAYADPSGGNDVNAVQDAAGNDAASLAPTVVTNAVPDTTAPVFVSAGTSTDGSTLVLTYSEALDAANVPAPGAFVVNVNGTPVTVTALSVAGSTLVLTLATPVANGASVSVAYNDPTTGNDTNAVQDAAGNDALSLPATAVSNFVPDTLAPTLQISVADLLLASGETTAVTFTFSEAVTGFTLQDVLAAGGTLSAFVQVNATTWTANFTQDGSAAAPAVSVANGTFTDLALNAGVGSAFGTAQGWAADISAPTLLISAADTALASGEATLITFTFSEAVAGFALGDVVVQGGALTGFTQVDAATWTATFTQDGTATPPSVAVAGGAYTDIAANPGAGYALNPGTGFTADIAPPQLQTLSTNAAGLEITLVYNEALDAARPPVAGNFEVRVNGTLVTVSTVTVSGSSVVLGLATAVVFGDAVTLAYNDPSAANDANATQDSAGNDAASVAVQPVINIVPSTDTTAPTLVISAADLLLARGEATLVTFEFSETVQGFAAGDVVVAGGALTAFTRVDANTYTAIFTQDGTATAPSIGVSSGTYGDAALNPGTGYVLDAATGLTADITPPALLGAVQGPGGTTLVLTYSEALDAVRTPAAGTYVVNAGGVAVAVTGITVSGSSVVLALASALPNGATVTLGYADPTAGNDANAIQDLAGNDAASSAGVAIADNRPPLLQGASVTGNTLTLSFDEALGAAPPVGSFVVNANGVPVAVTGVVVSGNAVVLTLAAAAAAGAVVTVGYTDPTSGNDAAAIQDLTGNDAVSLAAQPVANTRQLAQVDEDDISATAAAVVSGTFAGVAANAALTFAAPPAGLTSGGQAIVWTGVGTSTLTGHVGSATGAVAIVLAIASGGANAGQYTVSLLRPVDHAAGNGENLRNFDVGVLVNGAAGNLQLTVGVVDDVPVAAPSSTQVLTTAGSVQGNAALTFGADGGYVQTVSVDGIQFSYNPAAGTLAQSGSSTSVYAYSYDNQSTLTVTTLRGETFTINLATGQYSMLATGIRSAPAVNVAPVAGLGESGGLLGLVSLNTLGLIDVSTQQAFTASDANNNIREVTLVFGGVSVGSLLRNPFIFSSSLAAELGLRVELSSLLVVHQLRITALNGQAIDNLKLNELLGSVYLDTSLLGGVLTVDLLASLNMTVTDTAGLVDTASASDALNLQLLQSLLGSQASGLQVGTAGADTLSGAAGLAADASRRLYGYAGNDTLLGNIGNDILRGGAGNDTLSGFAGNDILIGGSGADTLTGGQGSDVFRWEAGDQGAVGAPVVDTITDFDVNSVWAGGDVLHLAALLNGEGRIGFTSGNLSNYLHFAKVGNDTLISISSQGGYVGGFRAANAGQTDQQILLKNVDLVTGYGTDAAIITHLLGQGKLEVDLAGINTGALDNTTDVGFGLVDRDGDTAAGSVTFDTGAVTPVTFNPNNRAPELQVSSTSLLGLIGLDALNTLNLSSQDFSVIDRDRNLSQVEIRYQPLLGVNLTPIQLTASQKLAAELGLQLRVVNNPGVLNLVAPSSTLFITALVAGMVISNQAINELLASVHLTDQGGTLLNGALLSADVLNALTISATDAQGASSTASVGQLLDVNLADNVNDSSGLIEGTNGAEVLVGTLGADRLYGYGGNDTLLGGDGDDLLRGGSGDDILDGGNGDDLLIGGSGNDTFIGGAGNDTIQLLAPNYASISGGSGFDTLLLDGGINLTLTNLPTRISSIERIDLGTGDTGSVLTLSSQAVLELTDNPSHTLQIVGDARDSVVMSGATKGAVTVVGDVNFVSYAWGAATVLVEQEITNVVV